MSLSPTKALSQDNPSKIFLTHSLLRNSQQVLKTAYPVRRIQLTWPTQAVHPPGKHARKAWIPRNLRGITLVLRMQLAQRMRMLLV